MEGLLAMNEKRLRTLVINKSDSYCGECRASILDFYSVKKCPQCGVGFEYSASDYYGLDSLERGIKATRPDLTWMEIPA